MNIGESLLTALESLRANLLRSLLTMLGVIIGVGAVITLMALGNGLTDFVTGEIQAIGTNLINITTDPENSGGAPALSISDVEALSNPQNAPAIQSVAGLVAGAQQLVYQGQEKTAAVTGITPSYFGITNRSTLQSGDLLVQADMDSNARVAVLGATLAEELFVDEFPIGESIKIAGTSYEVIGVLAARGGPPQISGDESVFIPLSTAQSRLYTDRTRNGKRAVTAIFVQARDEDSVDQAIDQVTSILREQHGIIYAVDDDFILFSQTDLLDTFGAITDTLAAFLALVAGISLFVGGIGIMNIMLVSVTERTREIGIRKAVGAQRRDVLLQFLIESLVLSLIGGIIGIIFGLLGSWALGQVLDQIEPVILIGNLLLATTFASMVGLIFGIYPAWRAAQLRPIEALRYE